MDFLGAFLGAFVGLVVVGSVKLWLYWTAAKSFISKFELLFSGERKQ